MTWFQRTNNFLFTVTLTALSLAVAVAAVAVLIRAAYWLAETIRSVG